MWILCVAGYVKDAIVGACHRTIDGQEHKIIWRAGPERDTIFHLPVTACREQGSHCRDEGVASRWQGLRAPAHSSRKSWERTARELTTLILWLINSPWVIPYEINVKNGHPSQIWPKLGMHLVCGELSLHSEL